MESRFGLGPDSWHGPQAAGQRRLARLPAVRMPSARSDFDGAICPEPEIATQTDETGRELTLELREFCDLARLDKLTQPRLDAGADPPQLAHPPGPHQFANRDERAHVSPQRRDGRRGPSRVGIGVLEQRRVRL